jgi:signal transduction histidine kinase
MFPGVESSSTVTAEAVHCGPRDEKVRAFLAVLAHELRNPLAPISAAADMLRLAPNDPQRVRQSSELIARQVKHLTCLVDDLLDVSGVTRGLITLQLKPVDLRRVMSDAIEQVDGMFDTKHLRFTRVDCAEPAMVKGDHKRLVQVVANLLNNAAKFTLDGGQVALALQLDAEHAKLTVTDNGIGIAPELLPHVFDLFAQGERVAERGQGGLGIGLALVKSLVELHQGVVKACSAGIGQGSEFCVCLPRLHED